MSLVMYKIVGREIIPTDEKTLEKDNIYIIIDKHTKKSKIWIWSGSGAKNMDRYFAGVSATKIKSKKRLYGASIEVVEEGHEPGHFPDLTKIEIKEPSGDKFEMEKVIIPLSTETTIKSESTSQVDQYVVQPSTIERTEEQPSFLKEKIRSLLKEISLDMEKIHNRIKTFLSEL